MTTPPDLYLVLGVHRDATQEEITQASRELLRRYHPDTRPPGADGADRADAALQGVLAASAVLRDPVRRASYDARHPTRAATPTGTPIPVRVRVRRGGGATVRPVAPAVRPSFAAPRISRAWVIDEHPPRTAADPMIELVQALLLWSRRP